VVELDVADEAGMRDLFECLSAEGPPLRGIFHLATEYKTALLDALDRESLEAMMRPKVAGTWLLHQLSQGLELDCFVVFSSMASLLGSVSLGHYSAANQFMDALSHHRLSEGLPSLAINWGLWEIARGVSADQQRSLAQVGFTPLTVDAALESMARLITSGIPQAAVASVDWSILKAAHESQRPRPVLEQLGSEGRATTGCGRSPELLPADQPDVSVRAELHKAAPAARRSLLEGYLRDRVAKVLRLSVDRLDVGLPLSDFGFDSLMAIELRNALQAELQSDVPVSRLLAGPSVKQMTEELLERVSEVIVSASQPVNVRQGDDTPTISVDDLSDRDVDAMLRDFLQGRESDG
jgi:hypothetical protein